MEPDETAAEATARELLKETEARLSVTSLPKVCSIPRISDVVSLGDTVGTADLVSVSLDTAQLSRPDRSTVFNPARTTNGPYASR